MDKTPTSPATKGLLISAVYIGYSLIVGVLNQVGNREIGFIPFIIVLAGALLSTLHYVKQMDGNVTFMNVFFHGFKATALVAALAGFWIAMLLKFNLFHAYDIGAAAATEMLTKQSDMTSEEIQKHLATYRNGAAPMAALSTVVMTLFVGAIGSLAGAAFSKRNTQFNTTS